ncbi:MAG: hypothetical protein ABFR36_00660 [Acidobacteriota bacterium]
MEHKNELKRVSVNYLNEKGNTAISDLDTPSFIRKEFNLIYREKDGKKVSGKVPGPVTKLFNILFGDEEISFA